MQIHQVQPKTKRKKIQRIGRGGKRGTYSGRGIKGQRSRAGHRMRPELRDIIRRIPKRRGYSFTSIQEKATPVSLEKLEKNFENGDIVSPKTLVEKKVVKPFEGKMPKVKILGTFALTKKLTIEKCAVSASAKAAIEKAGGELVISRKSLVNSQKSKITID